jgi:hypothetical protein
MPQGGQTHAANKSSELPIGLSFIWAKSLRAGTKTIPAPPRNHVQIRQKVRHRPGGYSTTILESMGFSALIRQVEHEAMGIPDWVCDVDAARPNPVADRAPQMHGLERFWISSQTSTVIQSSGYKVSPILTPPTPCVAAPFLDLQFVSAYIALTTMIALRHWLGKTGAPSVSVSPPPTTFQPRMELMGCVLVYIRKQVLCSCA